MMSRWGLEGLGSFEQARVAAKEVDGGRQCYSKHEKNSASVTAAVNEKGELAEASK